MKKFKDHTFCIKFVQSSFILFNFEKIYEFNQELMIGKASTWV